jgi:LPXTG-site transpeptidase (sortase) family protein
MAQEVGARGNATPQTGRRRRPLQRVRTLVLLLGLAAVLAGVGVIVAPIIGALIRGHGDQSALNSWNHGGSNALRGAAAADAGHTVCGSASPADYALVKFGAPADDHYAGVAGDGTWDLLNQRSMVHYHGTPDPGQRGNVIIAFHREPDYQNIDQLTTGDTVTVQDRSCKTYVYKITDHWDLPPDQVTQLVPTSGYDLTLITCDPWWQDYNRLVWRATLVSSPSSSSGSNGGAAAPGNPSF